MKVKYDHRTGARKQTGRKWLTLPILGLFGGLYLLVNVLTPAVSLTADDGAKAAQKLVATQPEIHNNRLYVPKVSIDVAVVPIEGNETLALEKGAINRAPKSGNPKDGGNFVLAAHRFNLGLTPSQTRAKSPFYHIDQLKTGDDIYVDYQGIRYAYRVQERKMVMPDAVEIEAPTNDNRLTMYTCELAGPKAGREVVIAKPVGTIVWNSGKPALKTL